jgi:putative ABC transport system permease protein
MFSNFKWRTDPSANMMQTFARMRPGVTIERARQHLAAISPAALEEAKEPNLRGEDEKYFLAMKFEPHEASAGFSWLAVSYGRALWILLAAVGAVLLIATTNLTNLFLARSSARSHEIAIRLSLGAPASRIRRQLLIESALLAATGAAAGLLWANWLISALERGASSEVAQYHIDTSLDWRMFAFLGCILVVVVLLAGLAPSLAAGRVSPQLVLRRHSGASPALRFRGFLIVLQTALSLTLVAGAGLMLTSLQSLLQESSGFQSDGSLFLTPDLYNAGISRERMPRAYQTLLDDVRSQSNIAAAAWTKFTPLSGSLSTFTVDVPGRTDLNREQRTVFTHRVSDGYFAALGIPLLAGVDLPPVNSPKKDVCVLSEGAARRFFGSPEQAIGQRLTSRADTFEIIGVVGDSKYQNIREAVPLTLYQPYWRGSIGLGMTMAVRYLGHREAVVQGLQRLFQKEAGRLPFTQVRSVRENISNSLSAERLLAWLLAGFAGFGLLISATGLWGLLSYSVEQRRKELGIRLALGATPGRIRRAIRYQGLALTGIGLVCGVLLSYGLRRSLDAYLFGVAPTDPRIWAAGIVTLLMAAIGATALPAWRAARVDPVAMLREE